MDIEEESTSIGHTLISWDNSYLRYLSIDENGVKFVHKKYLFFKMTALYRVMNVKIVWEIKLFFAFEYFKSVKSNTQICFILMCVIGGRVSL